MKEYVVNVYDDWTEWYQNGKLHREDDLPAIENNSGDKHWYINGKRHRENAPAIEYDNGTKEWYQNGQRHREDGAAIEYVDGGKYWYLNDVEYSEDEFKKKINEVKELTVKEIIKLLGYEIKII